MDGTVLVALSDLHCGSPVGLMPPKQWQLRGANVSPNKLQRLVYRVYDKQTRHIGEMRQGKRLVVVLNGDLIEGDHHGNKQVITTYMQEQEAIAIDSIDRGLQNFNFDREGGDLLYVVRGTDSHAGESEERIAHDLEAMPFQDDKYCHPSLRLNICGVSIWAAHKIAGVGRGTNRGNALRNRMRDYYFDAVGEGLAPPDYVIGSHFHQRLFSPYAYRDHEIRGFVLPPYKAKDDYTFAGFSPFGLADLGLLWIQIGTEGHKWGWLSEEIEQVKEIRL